MKTNLKKGFTLVEIMIGFAAGIIVVLTAGALLVGGNLFWSKAWEKTSLQRDASYAMQSMIHGVKAGRSAELEDGGKGIKIYGYSGWIRYYMPTGTKNLEYQVEGQTSRIVVNGNVEDVGFTMAGKIITIALKLKKNNFQNYLISTAMMRNYGG